MKISSTELEADGFQRAGTVYPDPLRVQIDRDFHGFVVYIMVANHEYMKGGHTVTFRKRMLGSFNALKNKMGDRADHPRYQEKTFKEHAQATIRAKHEIELWAQQFPSFESMIAKEEKLNSLYQGLWTKEGHRGASRQG